LSVCARASCVSRYDLSILRLRQNFATKPTIGPLNDMSTLLLRLRLKFS
jgi:hypothetical protein